MAQEWRIAVKPLPRYGLPLIAVKLDGLFDAQMAVATSEARTSISPRIAQYLLMDQPPGPGRMVIPSDSGPLIANRLRVHSLLVPVLSGEPLELGPLAVAIAYRPQSVGVAGLLGVDLLARFTRICYEAGPPARLTLEG